MDRPLENQAGPSKPRKEKPPYNMSKEEQCGSQFEELMEQQFGTDCDAPDSMYRHFQQYDEDGNPEYGHQLSGHPREWAEYFGYGKANFRIGEKMTGECDGQPESLKGDNPPMFAPGPPSAAALRDADEFGRDLNQRLAGDDYAIKKTQESEREGLLGRIQALRSTAMPRGEVAANNVTQPEPKTIHRGLDQQHPSGDSIIESAKIARREKRGDGFRTGSPPPRHAAKSVPNRSTLTSEHDKLLRGIEKKRPHSSRVESSNRFATSLSPTREGAVSGTQRNQRHDSNDSTPSAESMDWLGQPRRLSTDMALEEEKEAQDAAESEANARVADEAAAAAERERLLEQAKDDDLEKRQRNFVKMIQDPFKELPRPTGCPEGELPDIIKNLGGNTFLAATDILDQLNLGVLPNEEFMRCTHPIFQWGSGERMIGIHPFLWCEMMADTISLASKLLDTRPVLEFFARAMFANVGLAADTPQGHSYLKDLKLTDSLLAATKRGLVRMAPYVDFEFREIGQALASVESEYPRRRVVPLWQRDVMFRHMEGIPLKVTLSQLYEQHLTRKKVAPGATGHFMLDRRVHFMMAVTLLQTLAHLVFQLSRVRVKEQVARHRHAPFAIPPSYVIQPKFSRMSQLKDPDWGLELTIAMFGRVLRGLAPTKSPATIPYWGIFAEHPSTVRVKNRKKAWKWQMVQMAWVVQWFSDKTFEKFEEGGLGALHPMTNMWCSQDLTTVRYIDPDQVPLKADT